MYHLKSFAESFLNALPQAIIQSKLYVMGNDPRGVHVYINTTLFLYSVVGSLSSVLKSIALFIVELHEYNCTVVTYSSKLLKFESFDEYHSFVQNDGVAHTNQHIGS